VEGGRLFLRCSCRWSEVVVRGGIALNRDGLDGGGKLHRGIVSHLGRDMEACMFTRRPAQG
jgi:hypothetical protein